jgi:hypothetical protein
MSLPLGGPISMSQINTELVRSSTAQISLDSAENGSYAAVNNCSYYKPSATNPAAMSEWRGYDHQIMCPTTGYCGSGGRGLIQLYGANTSTHTISVGNGPGFFRLRVGYYGVWPGTFPTGATGTPAAWWRSRITVTGTSYDILWAGDTLIGNSGYFGGGNIEAGQNFYNEFYSYVPAGSNSITITTETYSPNLLFNFTYHLTCITSGSLVGLHWSPDTIAHACDSSYVYYESGELGDQGYSGYLNFLVSGNGTLSVGNAIYAYPSGSTTSTSGTTNAANSAGYGYTGGLSYTYPNYNSAAYYLFEGQSLASVPIYSFSVNPLVASNGYYSDGTNWALVTGGAGVISSTGPCYYTLTWSISIATYYSDSQASISTVASYTGNGTWSSTSNVGNGANVAIYGYGHTLGGFGGVTVDIYIDSVLQVTSTGDSTTTASYNLTMDDAHSVSIYIYDSI